MSIKFDNSLKYINQFEVGDHCFRTMDFEPTCVQGFTRAHTKIETPAHNQTFDILLGRRQANLCFHFAGSGENLPDIAKSRDTKYGKEAEQLPFLSYKLPFLTSAHVCAEVKALHTICAVSRLW